MEVTTAEHQLRRPTFFREIVAGIISGAVVLTVGQVFADRDVTHRIYEANIQNYSTACKVQRELAAFQGMNVIMYDTMAYKSVRESGKSEKQRNALRGAIQAMDVVNAITTSGIIQPKDGAEMHFKQERTANNVVKLLSEYDSRFSESCLPALTPSPSTEPVSPMPSILSKAFSGEL